MCTQCSGAVLARAVVLEDGVEPALLLLLVPCLLGDAVLDGALPAVVDARDARDLHPLPLHVLCHRALSPGPGGPCSHMPANNFTLVVRPEMGLAGCAGGAGGPPKGAVNVGGDLVAP